MILTFLVWSFSQYVKARVSGVLTWNNLHCWWDDVEWNCHYLMLLSNTFGNSLIFWCCVIEICWFAREGVLECDGKALMLCCTVSGMAVVGNMAVGSQVLCKFSMMGWCQWRCVGVYHQCPLDPESQLLTTFITSHGRFCMLLMEYHRSL